MNTSKTPNTPVRYISEFKISELQTTKISQSFDDGTTNNVKVPVFDGINGGLEAFFVVVNSFSRQAMDELLLVDDTDDSKPDYQMFFKKFRRCLDQEALIFWDTEILTKFPDTTDHTEEAWNEAMTLLKRSFAGGSQARDHILKYLQTSECKKPFNKSVEAHVRRIKQLIEYANKLPGNFPQVTTIHQYNSIIFQTFPEAWQLNWNNAGKSLATSTINDLVEYFAQQKITADYTDQDTTANTTNKRPHKDKTSDNSIQQDPNNTSLITSISTKKLKYSDKYVDKDEKCPLHKRGTHKWGDCRDNKMSPNFILPKHLQNQTTSARNAQYGRRSEQHYFQTHNTQNSTNLNSNLNRSPPSPPNNPMDQIQAYDLIGPQHESQSTRGSRTADMSWPPTRNF